MDIWTPTLWPPYDHQFSIFDKMHNFRQAYQQHPIYRVPPEYPPFKSFVTPEQFSHHTKSPSPPPPMAELSRLEESSGRRQQRCQLPPGEQLGRDGGQEGSTRRSPPPGNNDEEEEGGLRRESSPDSTGTERQDARSYCKVLTFQDPNGQSRKMIFPKALDLDRPKRARTSFTAYQLERLETEFKSNQYMVGRDRARLATNLGLTETQVKVWFQNRRTKHKREQCREAEFQEKNAESIAACNILRLLQNQQLTDTTKAPPSVDSISPIRSRLVPW